jgi:hypothetical protein
MRQTTKALLVTGAQVEEDVENDAKAASSGPGSR